MFFVLLPGSVMRITSADITTAESHVYRKNQGREESLRVWVGPDPDLTNTPADNSSAGVNVQVSAQAETLARIKAQQHVSAADSDEQVLWVEDPATRTIRLMLEMLTGKKIQVDTFRPNPSSNATAHIKKERSANTSQMEGWGLEYDFSEYTSEHEETSFSAQGLVITEDEKEIRFNLSLVMTRNFAESTEIHIRAGDAKFKDPLVINFDDNAAALTDTRFSFDLEAVGSAEYIPFLRPGSGFLTFDKNEDGVINDGTELFGPLTGNGFKELAKYDGDSNGWLDESDPIFTKLSIWAKDAAGTDYLSSLYERGVGAILLSPTQTDFALKTEQNQIVGEIKATSIFLQENGRPGTIQEIDLAI